MYFDHNSSKSKNFQLAYYHDLQLNKISLQKKQNEAR
jgi:hypothetical protein